MPTYYDTYSAHILKLENSADVCGLGLFSIFFRDTHSPSSFQVLKVRIFDRTRTFEDEIPILIEKVKKNYSLLITT